MIALWGFIIRDLAIERKYRFNLLLKTAAVFFQMAVFYFVSKYISPDYFPFVFVGIVFSQFFQFWLSVFSEAIRQEQYMGTAEMLFCCPRHPLAILAFSAAGKAVLFCVEMLLFVIVGIVVFKVHLSWSWAVPGLAALQTLIWGSLGLAAASVIMCVKRGDPVSWLVTVMVDLVSGVYFPIAILPDAVRHAARFLPTTVALDMWRIVLQQGQPAPASMWLNMAAWAAVCLAGALIIFSRMYMLVRMKGDLGSY